LISPLIRLGDWIAKATLSLFGIEMTGAWLETEVETIESRSDLRNRLGSVLEKGDLSEERREEVMNALQVGETPISEIMVPPEEIVALSTAVDPAENARRIEENPHTRYPLVGEDLEDFRGIVYVPALTSSDGPLLSGEVDLEDVASPPMTMAADTTVSDAIDQFQTERQELALVLADGEIVGMLTVTDALEELVGELEDPMDSEIGA
ncbi:MAG: CBS domain-containing protein, partial [Haloarculaceae archaeon]